MQEYRFETSIENFISRIPSMFAYLELNDDWTATLHPATDSFNGSWGKIVENIALPCGVNLCLYVETFDAIPAGYVWDDTNTFVGELDVYGSFTELSPEFIRVLVDYAYVETKREDGLEYNEMNSIPYGLEVYAPENIKIAQYDSNGNYVTDCDGNLVYKYYVKQNEYTFYNKKCLLIEGKTYSYRTLIDHYYTYKEIIPEENTFLKFMEKGIGKVWTDKGKLGLEDKTKYPSVPEYVYLAQVDGILAKYEKLHRLCEYYRTHFLSLGKDDETLEAKCREYETIGGDVFMTYLNTLRRKANEVASEYLCYAENNEGGLEIYLNLPVLQSKNDLGYLSCDVNEFTPGGHYRHGEILTYNGRSYICVLNRFLPGGNNYPYVLCNGVLYKASSNRYEKVDVFEISSGVLPYALYNGRTYVYFGGEYYMWNGLRYSEIDVTEYCSGAWNDDMDVNEFDAQHFVLLSEYIGNGFEFLNIPDNSIFASSDAWYSQDNTYGNRFMIYVTVPNIPRTFIYPNIKHGDVFYVWDETLGMYVMDPDASGRYLVQGMADSVLKSLRSYAQYIDGNEFFDEPGDGEDWLYYYKIGNLSNDTSVLWDENGNIRRFGDTVPNVGQYVTDLIAYGSILTGIECNTDDKTLIFTYVTNAHLKAELAEIDSDVDGNPIYRYKPFEYDVEDDHGVMRVEKFRYTDPDITTLIENGDFEAFVEGRVNDIENYMVKYGYKKFVFSTESSLVSTNVYNEEYTYPYVRSEYTEVVMNELDYIYQPLFKKDYFTGYAYEPSVDASVDIRRGNGASYERHIRLGDYKTVNDMSETAFFRTTV